MLQLPLVQHPAWQKGTAYLSPKTGNQGRSKRVRCKAEGRSRNAGVAAPRRREAKRRARQRSQLALFQRPLFKTEQQIEIFFAEGRTAVSDFHVFFGVREKSLEFTVFSILQNFDFFFQRFMHDITENLHGFTLT